MSGADGFCWNRSIKTWKNLKIKFFYIKMNNSYCVISIIAERRIHGGTRRSISQQRSDVGFGRRRRWNYDFRRRRRLLFFYFNFHRFLLWILKLKLICIDKIIGKCVCKLTPTTLFHGPLDFCSLMVFDDPPLVPSGVKFSCPGVKCCNFNPE